MRSWISATSSLASVVITANVPIHSPEAGSFQFSQSPPMPKRPAVLHGDCIRLLRFLALDRLPLEEAINRNDAAAPAIGIPEGGQIAHGLAFGIDRFSPALRVLAPIGNKTPAQGLEGHLAGLRITPDHQQILAWRGVPARRIIVCTRLSRTFMPSTRA